MEKITAQGLVIREQSIGESDRLITVLTAKYGIIRAFSRGSKNTKSKKLAATSLLACSDFVFSRKKDAFTVDEAVVREVFFELRQDVVKMALAQYFCELSYEFCEEDYESEEILRLFLNSLWLLKGDKRTPAFIKAVTELRLMCLSGYMPAVIGCDCCGAYETDKMFFSFESGKLFCEKCPVPPGSREINSSVVQALRYVTLSEFNKLFSFELKEESLKSFCKICEGYMLNKTQRSFKTLDFYNMLKDD